jgi:hypothetical protein
MVTWTVDSQENIEKAQACPVTCRTFRLAEHHLCMIHPFPARACDRLDFYSVSSRADSPGSSGLRA